MGMIKMGEIMKNPKSEMNIKTAVQLNVFAQLKEGEAKTASKVALGCGAA
ncbi:hypothetical protein C5S32_03880 [ANME-1 cluster archaeon GoMg1]|nr:hypothetical protein [ANME-1 cluster archaeon GoMg1]